MDFSVINILKERIRNLNCEKIYSEIISKAKSETRNKKKSYFEEHHIIPRCKGGNNSKENLVLLTAKEHYICHHLLHKLYKHDKYLFLAYHLMTFSNKQNLQKITPKQYEILRIENSKHNTGENNPNYRNKQNLSGSRNHRSKKVEICGNIYESLRIASKELNIPKTTLHRWIMNKKENFTYI